MQQLPQAFQQEARILEIHKTRQRDHRPQQQPQPPPMPGRTGRNAQPAQIIHQGGQHHEPNHDRLSPGIKKQGEEHQHSVAPVYIAADKIQPQQQRQKQQQKCQPRKNQIFSLFFSLYSVKSIPFSPYSVNGRRLPQCSDSSAA